MRVSDIMTPNVFTISPDAPIREAAVIMAEHDIGSLPVCEGEKVVGIITDRDIVIRSVLVGEDPKQKKVRDVMTSDIETVSPDADTEELSKMMAHKRIRRLPVVEEDGELIGIVALGDVATQARYYAEVSQTLADISMP